MARHFKLVITFATILLVGLGSFSYALPFLKRSFPSPSDAYATDWMSIFVIDHIRTTGSWPTGWHDLRDEYDRLAPAVALRLDVRGVARTCLVRFCSGY